MTANDPADGGLITRPGARRITAPAMLRTASILTRSFRRRAHTRRPAVVVAGG